MKFLKILPLFLLFLTSSLLLGADPECCTGNDTLITKDQDQNDLLKYLKGTWEVKGTWQVLEGEGKVKYSSRALLAATETYSPVLNGHFLEKKLTSKVSYYSRDLGKKITQNFSSLTLYTFNEYLGSFFFWYYDSSGAFLDAKGTFDAAENEYIFSTESLDDQGEIVSTQHILSIQDENLFNWKVRQKTAEDYEWTVSATGTSTRKGSS